jgi:hypothetical protein
MDESNRKRAGETAFATTPSSLERGFGLGEFQGKFSLSATAAQEPDEHYSEHGAFRVAETSERTSSETGDVENVTDLPPVPEIHQSAHAMQENAGAG